MLPLLFAGGIVLHVEALLKVCISMFWCMEPYGTHMGMCHGAWTSSDGMSLLMFGSSPLH